MKGRWNREEEERWAGEEDGMGKEEEEEEVNGVERELREQVAM